MLVALPIRRIRLLLAEVSYAEVMQGRLRAPVFRRAAPRSSFFGVAPPRPPFADVRRRDRAPEPLHLVDPGVGDVLRAPVAADRQSPATSLPKRPKAWRTPWRMGSSAAQRSPSFAVCQPTTSSRW